MDPEKIATLKRKLLQATDFAEITECFFEELGNDPAFIRSGTPFEDRRFLAALGQAAAHACGVKVAPFEGTPVRVAEHRLVHGALSLGAWTVMMFYFEDVEQGFMAIGDASGPSRFVRFSLVTPPGEGGVLLH